MDERESQLLEDLLEFIRGEEKPSAASIIQEYTKTHPGVESGAVRLAMMRLLDQRRISVGEGWRLILHGAS